MSFIDEDFRRDAPFNRDYEEVKVTVRLQTEEEQVFDVIAYEGYEISVLDTVVEEEAKAKGFAYDPAQGYEILYEGAA